MTVTLPYEFDTIGIVKVILKGAMALLVVVVVPGILYSLLVSHSTAATVQLLLIGALVTYFGTLFFKNLPGALGTITTSTVVVRPSRLYGIRMAGPVGTFSLQQFKAVRVERILGARGVQARWHERVCLMGRDGTPDILVARTALDAGMVIGRELATLLQLPYQAEIVPA
jgi:hypothetical protein